MDASCADMWKLLHGIVCMLRRCLSTKGYPCQFFADLHGRSVVAIGFRCVKVHLHALKTARVSTLCKAFEPKPGAKETGLRGLYSLHPIIWRRWGADGDFCLSLELPVPAKQRCLWTAPADSGGWMLFPTMPASRIMSVVKADTRLALPPSRLLLQTRTNWSRCRGWFPGGSFDSAQEDA